MLFDVIKNNSKIDLVEYKFITELYLSSIKQEDARKKLVKLSAEDIQEKIPSLNVNEFIDYMLKHYIKNPKRKAGYEKYLTEFFSNHTREDIAYAYAASSVGAKLVEVGMTRLPWFNEIPTPEAIATVHNLFARVTRIKYTHRFKNEGSVEAYLAKAFSDFFAKSFSREIRDAQGRGSMTVNGPDGEINLTDIRSSEDLDEKQCSYSIPEFKKLAQAILLGSRALDYGNVVDGVLAYDMFSYFKLNIAKSRFNAYKKVVAKELKISQDTLLDFKDINGELLLNKTQHTARTYNNRKEFLDILRTTQKNTEYSRLFEEIKNGHIGKNKVGESKFFGQGSGRRLFGDKDSTVKHQNNFWLILQGFKACESLLHSLNECGIDPLTVPVDIFRDPSWFSKVDDFEGYMKMYNNIKELEREALNIPELDNVYSPNMLYGELSGNLLENLKGKLLSDIGKIQDKPLNNLLSLPELINPDLCRNAQQTLTNYREYYVKNIYNLIPKIQATVVRYVRDGLLKTTDDINRILFRVVNGKIVDWYPVTKGTITVLLHRAINGNKQEIGNNELTQVEAKLIVDTLVKQTSKAYNELTDDDVYELFRLCSLRVYISTVMAIALSKVNSHGISTLHVVDTANYCRNLVDICTAPKPSFRKFMGLPNAGKILTCLPKREPESRTASIMEPCIQIVCKELEQYMYILAHIVKLVKCEEDKVKSTSTLTFAEHTDILDKYASLAILLVNKAPKDFKKDDYFPVGGLCDLGYITKGTSNSHVKLYRGNRTYYLHRTGLWICPTLTEDSTENMLPFVASHLCEL